MSRSRNIKPGFFTNDVLCSLPPLARILFAGLWTEADRSGRLEDRPARLKMQLLGYDQCDAEPLLAALHKHGFILRYESGGNRYIQVIAWEKHQNPHVKERESTIPAPCKHSASTVQAPEIPERAGLIPDSLYLIPDSLVKDSGAALRAAPPPAYRGDENGNEIHSRAIVMLSEAWELPESWGKDAEALGWKPSAIVKEAERFRQYWVSGKGSGKRRSVKGWRQSWSNWLLKAERIAA